ncbi:MAG: hypothetical protein HFH68_03265 [Lachnospiraceae bacterium]|nr:hypothetical protein [Lachnospiraceae bacterium]
MKILSDNKLAIIPFLPAIMPGKDTTHTKITELTGISDHVIFPDIAILQIKHTKIEIKSAMEKILVHCASSFHTR